MRSLMNSELALVAGGYDLSTTEASWVSEVVVTARGGGFNWQWIVGAVWSFIVDVLANVTGTVIGDEIDHALQDNGQSTTDAGEKVVIENNTEALQWKDVNTQFNAANVATDFYVQGAAGNRHVWLMDTPMGREYYMDLNGNGTPETKVWQVLNMEGGPNDYYADQNFDGVYEDWLGNVWP